MDRTPEDQTREIGAGAAVTTAMPAQPLEEQAEHRIVLLPPEHEGDAKALLVALIAIARRVACERQTVVESSEAGELAV